jgi:hypothetical protein
MTEPTQRIVLLGASNLQRGMSTVIETAWHVWGSPLDVLAACGHGRSYGMTSRVLGRSLPGIVACGLWDELAERTPLPTAALLTDVGNDIVYGADADQIRSWLVTCVERLVPVCQTIVITGLPLSSLRTLSGWRFRLLRSLLFPCSHLALEPALECAAQVDVQLRMVARQYGAAFVSPLEPWYGWDPIHIRMRYWPRAWSYILGAWKPEAEHTAARGSWLRSIKLHAQRPLQRSLFGIQQRRAQPSCKLSDHSAISLY